MVGLPMVADRFKGLYATIHGIKNKEVADAFYTAEKFHFLKLINDSKDLQACSKISLYGIFMDVAVNGLSFDPAMKHLYVDTNNVNIGTKESPRWEKRAKASISGIGELVLRQKQGQIKHADNVVIVYEGDEFKYGTSRGETVLEHTKCFPRKSQNILAAYIKLTRNDGSIDYKVLDWDDLMQLKKFSKAPNSTAWTTGITGMMAAKTLKHAFKTYPKVRVGGFTALQSETIDQETEVVSSSPLPTYPDYGMDAQLPPGYVQPDTGEFTPAEEVKDNAPAGQQQAPPPTQQQPLQQVHDTPQGFQQQKPVKDELDF